MAFIGQYIPDEDGNPRTEPDSPDGVKKWTSHSCPFVASS